MDLKEGEAKEIDSKTEKEKPASHDPIEEVNDMNWGKLIQPHLVGYYGTVKEQEKQYHQNPYKTN